MSFPFHVGFFKQHSHSTSIVFCRKSRCFNQHPYGANTLRYVAPLEQLSFRTIHEIEEYLYGNSLLQGDDAPAASSAPQPSGTTQPDVVTPSDAPTPSDALAQPHVVTQPDTVTHPGVDTHPGVLTHLGLVTQPETVAQSDVPREGDPVEAASHDVIAPLEGPADDAIASVAVDVAMASNDGVATSCGAPAEDGVGDSVAGVAVHPPMASNDGAATSRGAPAEDGVADEKSVDAHVPMVVDAVPTSCIAHSAADGLSTCAPSFYYDSIYKHS